MATFLQFPLLSGRLPGRSLAHDYCKEAFTAVGSVWCGRIHLGDIAEIDRAVNELSDVCNRP